MEKGYNPDELRDARGRWTAGGVQPKVRVHPSRGTPLTSRDTDHLWGVPRLVPAAYHPDTSLPSSQGNSGMDVNKAIRHLNSNAMPKSQKKCAAYVENAINAGGVDLDRSGSSDAKDKGPMLENAGFTQVQLSGYIPKPGDVAVIQSYPGGNSSGHMTMWNGNAWVSDFIQNHGTSPYPSFRYMKAHPPYVIYRP
jgi:hypothetical protein